MRNYYFIWPNHDYVCRIDQLGCPRIKNDMLCHLSDPHIAKSVDVLSARGRNFGRGMLQTPGGNQHVGMACKQTMFLRIILNILLIALGKNFCYGNTF